MHRREDIGMQRFFSIPPSLRSSCQTNLPICSRDSGERNWDMFCKPLVDTRRKPRRQNTQSSSCLSRPDVGTSLRLRPVAGTVSLFSSAAHWVSTFCQALNQTEMHGSLMLRRCEAPRPSFRRPDSAGLGLQSTEGNVRVERS